MIAAIVAASAFGLALIAAFTWLVHDLLAAKDGRATAEGVRDFHARNANGLRAQLKETEDDRSRLKDALAAAEADLAKAQAAAVLTLPDDLLRDRVNGVHPDADGGSESAGGGSPAPAAEARVPAVPATDAPKGPPRLVRGRKR